MIEAKHNIKLNQFKKNELPISKCAALKMPMNETNKKYINLSVFISHLHKRFTKVRNQKKSPRKLQK